jgi:hypothetical protein
MTGSDLVLFSPSDTFAAWEDGNHSPEVRGQVEALAAFVDTKSPVCLLCGGPLKPIGLVGVIGSPDTGREGFAVCKPCSSGDWGECDRRIFDALGVTAVRAPGPQGHRVER